MNKLTFLVLFFTAVQINAKVLVSPIEAMQESFGVTCNVNKKNILLNNKQFHTLQKTAKTKLDTKIYRIYFAKNKEKICGVGILINRKVRSKNAVVLYTFEHDSLKDMQIIAFNEPIEYLPTKSWQEQFKTDQNIAPITGATLSARAVSDASKIAKALYNIQFKEK